MYVAINKFAVIADDVCFLIEAQSSELATERFVEEWKRRFSLAGPKTFHISRVDIECGQASPDQTETALS